MKKAKKIFVPKALASSNPVFTSHKWGNSANAGVNYKRPYSKTRSSAKAYMVELEKAK